MRQIDGVMVVCRSTEPSLDGTAHPEETHRFDKVVVCGGVMSRQLGEKLGDRINVYPVIFDAAPSPGSAAHILAHAALTHR